MKLILDFKNRSTTLQNIMNKEEARQALKDLYYYFYDLYLKDKINMYDWEDFKKWKWNIEDLITFDN